jgi:Holliday junction resolvasome RuvABC DNA-binding subunit
MTRDSLSSVPDELLRLRPKFRDASTPTKQAQTQSTVMQIQAGVLRPDSEVALEQLGYDQTDIERIQAEHRRASAGARMDSLIAAVKTPAQEVVDVAATTDAVRAG